MYGLSLRMTILDEDRSTQGFSRWRQDPTEEAFLLRRRGDVLQLNAP